MKRVVKILKDENTDVAARLTKAKGIAFDFANMVAAGNATTGGHQAMKEDGPMKFLNDLFRKRHALSKDLQDDNDVDTSWYQTYNSSSLNTFLLPFIPYSGSLNLDNMSISLNVTHP